MLAASKTLGKISGLSGGAFGGERFVDLDFEVQTAIELLAADKQDPARYAGVLMLKELARNNPTQFHPHVGLVLDSILAPLRDPRIHVREGAAELLAACLDILMQRERQPDNPYLINVWMHAQAGLKMSAPDAVHGSLLTYRELFLYGGMVSCIITSVAILDLSESAKFMKNHFIDTALQILKFRTHRDPHIRKMVIMLIPTLAVYDTDTFTEHFLHPTMAHLMTQLDSPTDKATGTVRIIEACMPSLISVTYQLSSLLVMLPEQSAAV